MTFYAGPEHSALALVESPAQLLNVIELARHEDDLAGLKIAVLAPGAGLTRNQLRSMITLARDAGHPVSWHEPRQGGMAVARSVRALADELSGVHRLVIGDPYSGVIHVIISVTRLTEVTIVDDGTATLEFARQWAAGEQLSRWHQVATPSQRRQIATLARIGLLGQYAAGYPLSRVAGSDCSPACPWTYRGFGSSATTSRGCAPGTRPRS